MQVSLHTVGERVRRSTQQSPPSHMRATTASAVSLKWRFNTRICRTVLLKPPEERSEDDLSLLSTWARQVKFQDEEIKHAVDARLLSKVMQIQTLPPDTIICTQGEHGDAFYMIFTGKVRGAAASSSRGSLRTTRCLL